MATTNMRITKYARETKSGEYARAVKLNDDEGYMHGSTCYAMAGALAVMIM